MRRHPNDCPCLEAVAQASEARVVAMGREIKAMWDAKAHGAGFRQIGKASGSSHEYVRKLWAIRPQDQYPLEHTVVHQPINFDTVPADDIDALMKLAQVQEQFDPTIPPYVVHGTPMAIQLGCTCEECKQT